MREVSTGFTCTLTNCTPDCDFPTDQKDCSRDCSAYASSIGYSEVLGSHMTHGACDTEFSAWYESQQAQCYTVCGYNSYTNIGGCCVAKKLVVPCTDCPGAHPVCPQTCGG